jgi:hypothetical protein
MPVSRAPASLLACGLATATCLLAPWVTAAAAEEPPVIAVVACDAYADLKKQARWVGDLVDQPQLDGFLESFIMMATQFKGLAGLDVDRPAGVIVTAEGPAGVPVPRGFVPVKDLGKLLAALQGVLGPAEEQDGVRVVSPPGMPPLEIVEKDGWAIFAPQGSPAAAAGLEKALDPIVKSFSLGAQVFPARMPAGLRKQLEDLLGQAAAMQAQQGQPVDPDALAAGLKNLEEVESIVFGASVDVAEKRVFFENQSVMVPGSAAGRDYAEMAKAVPTVPVVATADGKPAAIRGHAVVAIPASLREAARKDWLRALDDIDEPGRTILALVRQVLPAMIDAGGLDASLTVDTSAAKMADGQTVPAVTVGMKVKDGRALEAALKESLDAKDALLVGTTVKFDSGKAGAANLHTVELDVAATLDDDAVRALGATLPITLGVTPTHAFMALGANADKRIAAAAGGGKPDADAKPLAGLDVSLAPLLAYAAETQQFLMPNDPDGVANSELAEVAATLPSTLLQVLVQPIERGVAARISADSGAIKILRLLIEARTAVPPPRGGFGPGPVPQARPVPLPGRLIP